MAIFYSKNNQECTNVFPVTKHRKNYVKTLIHDVEDTRNIVHMIAERARPIDQVSEACLEPS